LHDRGLLARGLLARALLARALLVRALLDREVHGIERVAYSRANEALLGAAAPPAVVLREILLEGSGPAVLHANVLTAGMPLKGSAKSSTGGHSHMTAEALAIRI
jgi:hypothetical protein